MKTDPVFSISLISKEKRITDVGLRVIVTSFLIDDGRFKRGKVENISNKEVKIFVEGTEGNVKDMLKSLEEKLKKVSADKNLMIPERIEIGEPQELGTNPHSVQLPKLTDFAQSLMLEQTGKGVCVMSSINLGLETGFNFLGGKFDKMTEILRKYLEKSN